MKSIQNIIGRTAKVIGLLTLAVTLTQAAAQATTLIFEARVTGYTQRGNGWVLVRPELRGQLGGKVIWDNARNSYVTDRIARGEILRITLLASTPKEQCYKIMFIGVTPAGEVTINHPVGLPYVNTFPISPDPAYDNVIVTSGTLGVGLYSQRIPIGSR